MITEKLLKGYSVEWTPNCPRDEFGELDIDRADTRFERFATIEEARKRAKAVLAKDIFGSVLIRDFYWQDYDEYDIPYFDYEDGPFLEEVR